MTYSFFIPGYIELIQKSGNRWSIPGISEIYNLGGKHYDPSLKYSRFGLNKMGVLKELYKRYQGLDGWYLVHMAEKEYYYCGATSEDVERKLVELGIRRGV